MIRYIYIFSIIFYHVLLHGQVNETFEDSTWSVNHGWHGQINDFKIAVDGQLQSIGNEQGMSRIYTRIQADSVSQWEVWFKMAFAPSDNNRLRIYVLSDDSTTAPANAYYLEIGENLNNDAIKFYRKKNGIATLLAVGTTGALANDPSMARILLTLHSREVWTLGVDYTGGKNFAEEWNIIEPIQSHFDDPAFFMISCEYTSTRRDKFFFDDIYVGASIGDILPPSIIGIKPDSTTVLLTFNEAVDSVSATDAENYAISNGVGQPWKVIKINTQSAQLYLTKPLVTGAYEIICKQLKDLQGNVALNVRAKFEYKLVQNLRLHDLLITEIMADPSPAVGLPLFEYVEVMNTTNHAIDMSEVIFRFDQNEYSISSNALILESGQFLILCESSAESSFNPYGRAHALARWPAIRNTDGVISLWQGEKMIHNVGYDDSWYQDSQKANGGWSLEMINTANHCDKGANWSASTATAGGTPGQVNALNDDMYRVPLKLDSTIYLDNNRVRLHLNKLLSPVTRDQLQITPSINYNLISGATLLDITFDQPLSSGVIYQLSLNPLDCDGVNVPGVTTTLAKIESPEKNDLIINEILFNPVSGGSDYVELYNRSTKIFALKNLILRNQSNNQERTITSSDLILPGTYWVLSPDRASVLSQYTVAHPDQLIAQSLPTLSDDQGQVSLLTPSLMVIDSCTYDKSYHDRFLNSQDGVALERIDYNLPPARSNWHSAAGSAGYGTPTSKNSTVSTSTVTSFVAKLKVFTPDHDGIDDLFYIDYTLPGPGYAAQVRIFDDRGHSIKRLANNVLLAREGRLEWDGSDDHNQPAPTGIYIFRIEAIDADGRGVREMLTGVLSR